MPASPAGPDELERLFRRLVLNLVQLDPSRLHRSFPVADIYQSLVPYRTHRTSLGIDASEDYEMTVLRLLAGERGYAFVEPEEVRVALANEARSVNPDTTLFRRFAGATVALDAEHVRGVLGADREPEPSAPESNHEMIEEPMAYASEPTPQAAPAAEPMPAPEPEEELPQPELPFSLEEQEEEIQPAAASTMRQASAPCSFCGGELPVGRTLIFCPHCGQNVGVVHCPVCGTELDVGWRFCITCGRQMAGLG